MLQKSFRVGLGYTFALLLTIFLGACTSVPKANLSAVSENQAKAWFGQYCSKGMHAQNGEIVVHAKTKEFRGQYPASIHFAGDGGFVLEVTSLIGGTLLRLTSNGKEMATEVPPKPQYNQQHISHYLGLDIPILSQLLSGDLPCPGTWKTGGMRVHENQMQILTADWKWNFEKSDSTSGGVPLRIVLQPMHTHDLNQIELTIENWDHEGTLRQKSKH